MGRMLETLKQSGGPRLMPVGAKAADAAVQDCVVDWEIGEEVPFIEVGGPNKKIELSPGLVQHPAQEVPRPPHHPVELVSVAVRPKIVQLTTTQPMTVAYEAWPSAAPGSSGISAEIIAYHQPDHPASKEYAGLLDAMLQGVKGAGPSALLLIGMKPQVGTSTVLLNLGTIAAQAKKLRVVLVDANLARAGLASRLGHTAAAGLVEVMDGTLALEQAILKTGIASLHLVPAGKKNAPLTAAAMSWLLTWLRERFDLVLIDGPTFGETAELAAQVPHATGIYLVLPQGEETNTGMAQSISRMGGRLCGLIHTHFKM